MFKLTFYQNNDRNQPLVIRERTRAKLNAAALRELGALQPDVCLEFAEPEGDEVPAYLLNFTESYKGWEYRDNLNDIDADFFPTYAEAVAAYKNVWQSFIVGTGIDAE